MFNVTDDMLDAMGIKFAIPKEDEVLQNKISELQDRLEALTKDMNSHHIKYTFLLYPNIKSCMTQPFFTSYVSSSSQSLPLTYQFIHQLYGNMVEHQKVSSSKTSKELEDFIDLLTEDHPAYLDDIEEFDTRDEYMALFHDKVSAFFEEVKSFGLNYMAFVPHLQKKEGEGIHFGLHKQFFIDDGYAKGEERTHPHFLPVNAMKSMAMSTLTKAVTTYLELEHDNDPMKKIHLMILKGALKGAKRIILFNN